MNNINRLFSILVDQLEEYYFFEIDDFTGTPLTKDEMIERHYERIQNLQVIAFKFFSPTLRAFSLRNCGSIEEAKSLRSNLCLLNEKQLQKLGEYLHLIDKAEETQIDSEILLEQIILLHKKRNLKEDIILNQSIYPNEEILWKSEIFSEKNYLGQQCIALPKLNLQFLSFYDYLYRNFILYQRECSYQIKKDIEDVIQRITPRLSDDRKKTLFLGWARMSSPISNFKLGEVIKPNLGEKIPSSVTGFVSIHLKSMKNDIKNEWMQLKSNDVLFLVKIQSPISRGDSPDLSLPFCECFGVQAIRGARIIHVLDSKGRIIGREITEEEKEEKRKKKREKARNYHWQRFREKIPEEDVALEKRTFYVQLDSYQYYTDLKNDFDEIYEENDNNNGSISSCFNVLIRRNSKQNNFSGVLSTLRNLMKNDNFLLPNWFQDVFLGYGDPSELSFENNNNLLHKINWLDTFIDYSHIKQSFQSNSLKIQIKSNQDQEKINEIHSELNQNDKLISFENNSSSSISDNYSLFLNELKQGNLIRFTCSQIRAIYSGLHEGLSLIVGPPGTGKTDVVVQLIHLLYHNFPNQRTLIITHSNQALNQIFEKLMHLNIDECHLLRLGHGESSLQNSGENQFQFNQIGRVDFILSRRLKLLKIVEQLAISLSFSSDVAYSCETSELFYKNTILVLWNQFLNEISKDTDSDSISVHFPFTKFFTNAATSATNDSKQRNKNKQPEPQIWQKNIPQPLFSKKSRDNDLIIAENCFQILLKIFNELCSIRPFELLRNSHERINYLLMKQAKVIAMTCTHASLRFNELTKLGFNVDNIIMEEAAQMLDMESFIPILTRKSTSVYDHPLRRLILLGDHHQLPPIIQNDLLQSYSHLDQSLFTRFVRLGVPIIQLDKQGRSRSSLSKLYNWRYENLSDLPCVNENKKFQLANSGFSFDYQFINVPDYNGHGEQNPLPHYYQNLGEAEYIVAVYQYMRLIGYPSSSISIITSYNGQKNLIRDVIKQRCSNTFFGYPSKITTVDRFQGQQNDCKFFIFFCFLFTYLFFFRYSLFYG